jgi:hypothetical protein
VGELDGLGERVATGVTELVVVLDSVPLGELEAVLEGVVVPVCVPLTEEEAVLEGVVVNV